jgi:hypothetical protein
MENMDYIVYDVFDGGLLILSWRYGEKDYENIIRERK